MLIRSVEMSRVDGQVYGREVAVRVCGWPWVVHASCKFRVESDGFSLYAQNVIVTLALCSTTFVERSFLIWPQ